MKPVQAGWPLWVWLRACNGINGSKIYHLSNGGLKRFCFGRGSDNLEEFLYRVIRRYPNTVLAADSEKLYDGLFERYRTRRTKFFDLPNKHNAIGYLVAINHTYKTVTASGYASWMFISKTNEDSKKSILLAAEFRKSEIQRKKYSSLTGDARAAAILQLELKELLKNEARLSR